ncbi:hypothetical protein TI39_contig4119g00007 [Zymoseptoria brevis]|uniref:Uncharacterized protein n=1 Tax=Zymoseptoria brevis TaxID=1047168 RepID=A0A0F4GD31_9PEZI|nr:hypothetical protein TI39_contig4119g00007 [Zymoseptoria brevis]
MRKANNAPPRAPPAAMMGTAVAGATPPDFVDVDALVEMAAEEEPEAWVVLASAAAEVPVVALLVLEEAEGDLLELAEEEVVAAAAAAPVLDAVEDEVPDLEAEDETEDEEDPDLEAEEEEDCAVARAAMPRTKIVENCIVGEVVLGSGLKSRVLIERELTQKMQDCGHTCCVHRRASLVEALVLLTRTRAFHDCQSQPGSGNGVLIDRLIVQLRYVASLGK